MTPEALLQEAFSYPPSSEVKAKIVNIASQGGTLYCLDSTGVIWVREWYEGGAGHVFRWKEVIGPFGPIASTEAKKKEEDGLSIEYTPV